ncbi:hypothetical protein COLO4_29603 [Corchorus olitorius]|uniref:Uncharacterized protein n=1 Tax=Corchorus olitorius TaxID=93759 RepID=A0A1R3HDY1_9ROSI|nr:hypothetical protein COLO4_29603 [Corchorus olitorius]
MGDMAVVNGIARLFDRGSWSAAFIQGRRPVVTLDLSAIPDDILAVGYLVHGHAVVAFRAIPDDILAVGYLVHGHAVVAFRGLRRLGGWYWGTDANTVFVTASRVVESTTFRVAVYAMVGAPLSTVADHRLR